ncbi:Guanine nucleotide exchange factor vav3, partial [Bulinus truncatus]
MAADEWRNCVDWLVRCQILSPDHKATKHDATAFDLAQALRDGVLLCHLLNTLQPGCVDMKDFSSRPQMSQFLCMKNIRTFLQTCTTVFGLDQRDLFKPNDLFDVKDFKKVLDTLSQLSKSDLSQKKFCGFPPDSKHEDAEQDGDIYGNLHDLAIENDLEDQEDIYDTVYQEDDDKIYDDLLKHRKSSLVSGLFPMGEPLTKRDHCIKELLETEKNYNMALNMIIECFIKPLHNVLPSADRDIIFAHIQRLSEVHLELNDKLQKAVNGGPPRLADVFIQYKTKLLIYGDYCSNLPQAQERIDKICENEQLRLKVQECERRANEGKFRLRDLLHVPMQRVLKYHLLMRELIKNTDKTSSEREGLEHALEAMQDLSLYVNEVKRDHESLILIEDIQNSINDLKMPPNTTLKDYGRFQKDGELKVMSHPDSRQRNRHIFLFDKVMLMCKAKIVDKFLWVADYGAVSSVDYGAISSVDYGAISSVVYGAISSVDYGRYHQLIMGRYHQLIMGRYHQLIMGRYHQLIMGGGISSVDYGAISSVDYGAVLSVDYGAISSVDYGAISSVDYGLVSSVDYGSGDTYSFKDAIVLGEFRIDDSPTFPDKKTEKWNFPFIMVKQDRTNAFTFYAKTLEQRDKWKEAINMALDNSNPAAGRNYIMQTFDTPRECDVCGKLLRGIFYQGYICQDSKKVVHKECIGKSTQPPQRPPRSSVNT